MITFHHPACPCTIVRCIYGRLCQSLALTMMLILLAACSADQAPDADVAGIEATVVADKESTTGPAEPSFTEAAIAEQQQFGDAQLAALAESNIACSLLRPDDLAEVFGTDFSDGRFSWFENENRRAPAALRGICLYGAVGLPTSTSVPTLTLRIYKSSDIVWALNRSEDEAFNRRFSQRPMETAPEIAERAYRKPHGADTFDLTCADLGSHIACLSAHFRLTENWVNKDVQIMARIRERLAALD